MIFGQGLHHSLFDLSVQTISIKPHLTPHRKSCLILQRSPSLPWRAEQDQRLAAVHASFAHTDLGYLRPRSEAPMNFMPRMSTELASLRWIGLTFFSSKKPCGRIKRQEIIICLALPSLQHFSCHLSQLSMASSERVAFLTERTTFSNLLVIDSRRRHPGTGSKYEKE